jgi:L-ascorbate metabolism protein UlaG (beta-lactamase superfamily)
VADYALFAPANIILITHEHGDHLDTGALKHIRTGKTRLVLTKLCAAQLPGGTVLKNGEEVSLEGVNIRAVPAYNLVNKRENGLPFHPKGEGNGYVLTFGDTRVYVAGDTENIPEMKELQNIDIAFLPMNLPYTMTPEMVAEAARSFLPKIVYPYHFGSTDTSTLARLLAGTGVEVRLRSLA